MDGSDYDRETGEVIPHSVGRLECEGLTVPTSGPYRWSQPCDKLFAAIAEAQGELENVKKDGTNPAFRAKYAKLGAVIDEVLPKFAKHGVMISQLPINGSGSNIGVVTLVAHKSGQWLESSLFVSPTKFDAQGAGSVITYLRRYALMSVAGVAPDDDDDGNAAVGRPAAGASGGRTAQGNGAATLGSVTRSPASPAPSEAKIDATKRHNEVGAAIDRAETVQDARSWDGSLAWQAMEAALRKAETEATVTVLLERMRDRIEARVAVLEAEGGY